MDGESKVKKVAMPQGFVIEAGRLYSVKALAELFGCDYRMVVRWLDGLGIVGTGPTASTRMISADLLIHAVERACSAKAEAA